MRMDRIENMVKNVTFSMLSEFMLAVLKIVSRYVFVQILGKEYLGVTVLTVGAGTLTGLLCR